MLLSAQSRPFIYHFPELLKQRRQWSIDNMRLSKLLLNFQIPRALSIRRDKVVTDYREQQIKFGISLNLQLMLWKWYKRERLECDTNVMQIKTVVRGTGIA